MRPGWPFDDLSDTNLGHWTREISVVGGGIIDHWGEGQRGTAGVNGERNNGRRGKKMALTGRHFGLNDGRRGGDGD